MRNGFKKYFLLLTLLVAACDRGTLLPTLDEDTGLDPNASTSAPLATFYPHSEGWKDAAAHGEAARLNSVEMCKTCHDLSPKAPTCQSCHTSFPHEKSWVKPEKHGATVLAKGTAACATACHGTDMKGGLSGISCNLCHATFPHPAGWKEPAKHGEASQEMGKTACVSCHEPDGSGLTKVTCAQCHANYPHPYGWKHPLSHGATALEKGLSACATACHGSDLAGGISGVACASCHSLYPHAAGWKQNGHGKSALQNGTSSCIKCHAPDGSGGKALSCQSCHATYPHPAGWKNEAGLPQPHGNFVIKNSSSTCATARCHGENLKPAAGVTQGPSCQSCHSIYPHSNPQWVTKEGTKENGGHGYFVQVELKKDTTKCQSCHGTDLKGGSSGVSCFKCHEDYPHPSGWKSGNGHGTNFSGRFTSISEKTSCWNCHGKPVVFDNVQNKTTLGKQSFCNSCHTAYPHVGYLDPEQDVNIAMDWEPVLKPNLCGLVNGWDKMQSIGHIYYLFDNPLLVDAKGQRPSFNTWPPTPGNSPLWVDAVSNTCGGTGGNCHSNGKRSYDINQKSGLCGGVCHNAAQPLPPALPPCPPPPPAPPGEPPPCDVDSGECG